MQLAFILTLAFNCNTISLKGILLYSIISYLEILSFTYLSEIEVIERIDNTSNGTNNVESVSFLLRKY